RARPDRADLPGPIRCGRDQRPPGTGRRGNFGTRSDVSRKLNPRRVATAFLRSTSRISMAIKTLDVDRLARQTGNVYETVAILSKRARQIASNVKAELDEKLAYYEGFGPEMEDA